MVTSVTIITLTTDSSHFVDVAIESAPCGECDRIEHLVVHDGSSAFTERLAKKYPWLRIVHGEGRGATAAVALAIGLARGDFIISLNSDDRMTPGSIGALVRASKSRPDVEVWTGGVRIFEQHAGGLEIPIRVLDDAAATALTLENVLDDLPLMTARFVRREVYDRLGPPDERFSPSSDREFAIRMVLAGVSEAPLGVVVSELRMHEGSQTIRRTNRRSTPAYLDEHLVQARRWMREPQLSPSMRNAFRDWHAREVLRKAYYELSARAPARAVRTLRDAFGTDAVWPWRARSAIAAHRLRQRGRPAP